MRGDAPARLDYLDATRVLLWPDANSGRDADADTVTPAGDTVPPAGDTVPPARDSVPPARDSVPPAKDTVGLTAVDMVVLPNRANARLLAPARPRRAAASAAVRYSAQQDVAGRIKGLLLAGGVASGLLGRDASVSLTVGDPARPSINDHLESVLGRPVLTSLALTHDRANRKPVLQVFDRRGATIAFAKIGVTELTRSLVDAEGVALSELAARDLPHVRVPVVLDHRRWNGLAVLVMSALPAMAVRAADPALVERAMQEVAGTGPAGPGAADVYLDGLRSRADAAASVATASGSARLRQWSELLEAECDRRDNQELTFGAWHGDWARWNFVARGRKLAVWDWERYARPAPVGFDRLHYFLQGQVGPHRDRFAEGAPLMLAQAPALLAGWSVTAAAARTTALLYLLDISLRYQADDQRATGGGGAIEQWALPTLRAALQL